MTKSLNHKFVFPLLNAVYFSATTAAVGWMAWTYFGPTWTLVPVLALGSFFAVAACVALLNVRTANRLLVGSSAFTLNRLTQRLIRLATLLLPIPVLAYCASFAFLSNSGNSDYQSQFANARLDFVSFEYSLFGKSALSGNQPSQATATADIDFGPFMADLQKKIKRNWTAPIVFNRSIRAQATFKVHSDGRMSDLALTKPSGSDDFDATCLRAIPQKFQALPAGASENVDIQFTFDYNVFDQNQATETSSTETLPSGGTPAQL